MGTALQERISGDRRQNIDEAMQCYQRVLQIRTRESMPHEWASTQMSMGNALQTRISGDRRANIDESIVYYRRALQIYTQESMPHDWAMIQMNMGVG